MGAAEGFSKFEFRGKGWDLFRLFIQNFLFTGLTLGVYYFWASVRIMRFYHRNVHVRDRHFDFHATGLERFVGFLKGAGVLALWFATVAGLVFFLTYFKQSKNLSIGIIYAYVYLTMFLALPFLTFAARRFYLSRVSYGGMRFSQDGKLGAFYLVYFKGLLWTILTLGIFTPWFSNRILAYLVNHSRFGNEKFTFTGRGSEYAGIFWGGYLLTILTLGIYGFWWQARLNRFFYENIQIQEATLKYNLRGHQLLLLFLRTVLLVVFTLGLGLPHAICYNLRVMFENIEMGGELDLEKIHRRDDKGSSAFAKGLEEAGDVAGTFL